MSSRDSVGSGPPVRRTSWTGALGAKLGRVLSPSDDDGQATLVSVSLDGEEGYVKKEHGGMVVVGKEGGE